MTQSKQICHFPHCAGDSDSSGHTELCKRDLLENQENIKNFIRSFSENHFYTYFSSASQTAGSSTFHHFEDSLGFSLAHGPFERDANAGHVQYM